MVYFSHSGQDTQAQKEQGLNGLTVEKPHIMNSFHWRWRWRWFVQNFLGFLKPFSHCCFTSFFQSKGKKLFSSPTHTPSASFVRCQSQSSRRDTPQILWSGLCTCTTPAGGKKQNKRDDSQADVVTASVSRQTPLFYLLNDFHQVLQHLPSLSYVFVGDDCSREVSQDVWAHCLDGVQVPEEKKQRKKITLSSSQNQVRTHLILQFNSAEEKLSDKWQKESLSLIYCVSLMNKEDSVWKSCVFPAYTGSYCTSWTDFTINGW